ncbi:hypothetical protein GCM10007147_31060 [Nocardiopsis kunsanensis]|uniref:ABC transporter domain-containing protein n=1 Tax=Nocardiopsis kunsanensis TaxID=141693 RepID=A0A919CJF3_9ACTN|nr:ABC transporter ATP-binding protein [Nocardiopsis kunsanensis]GHD29812.1 hypothetical protein GCM10007147_31060 [Nocardiopsis kunsanensis]
MLSNVHARARRGELTALLGPNGAGKSTLLRALSGSARPLAGECRVDGAPVAGLDPVQRARVLATVLTERDVPPLLSARDLVALGRHPHTGLAGRLGPRDHAVVDWALDAVGAGDLAGRRVAELSDGERQRVLTARALAQEPAVLLLDEPTAFLDVPGKVALTGLLRRLAREHDLAVVMCVHDLEMALRTADAVWLLDGGSLHEGTPEELTLDGAVGRVFDGADLEFAPAEGVFRLRDPADAPSGAAGVARVDPRPDHEPLLRRALVRAGWRVRGDTGEETDVGPNAPLLVRVTDDGYRTEYRGLQRSHGSLGALTRWATRLASGKEGA